MSFRYDNSAMAYMASQLEDEQDDSHKLEKKVKKFKKRIKKLKKRINQIEKLKKRK